MKQKQKPPRFASEADLCTRFLDGIDDKWTAYPETAGWDILLVRKLDGFQIGIQAKLKLNAKVLSQALEDYWDVDRAGPDCRAVVVPKGASDFQKVAAYIGLTVVEVCHLNERYRWASIFHPELPAPGGHANLNRDRWHELAPLRRHSLPDYVPDVMAGASAPVQLTEWKISALKILVTIEVRGYVTREDFKWCGIDHRRWTALGSGWLVRLEDSKQFVGGPKLPNFKAQHPKVYAEISAKSDEWMRPITKPIQ